MATFKFSRTVNIHWNGFDVKGPADTVFSIPDQLYEEFEGDIRGVEPSLTWIDTNEFQTLANSVPTGGYIASAIGASPISVATSSNTATISITSGTAGNGYILVADGTGGTIWNPASTSGLTSVVGVSPISATVSGGTVSVSLTANYQTAGSYQPAGTYVNAVIGTSPASVVTASGTSTVSIDQAAITGATSASNAQTLRTYVKNTTGTTIALGKAVYVSGATGDNALISLATASTEPGSSKTLGITAESIASDAFGYVVESGYLTGIDTTGISAGTSVWLGNTPGSLAFGSPPAEPSHSVYLGVVIREQQNNGSILVKVQNGYELDELHDVSAASPSDGDIIQYKTSSSLWTKSSIAGAGIAANVHTHNYQVSGNYQTAGTYVNAVIGTSPASVSTSSGTSTVSISSGTATNGQVLTANGSGGVSFTTVSSAAEAYYVTKNGNITGSALTQLPAGRYTYVNTGSPVRTRVWQSTSTTSLSSDTSPIVISALSAATIEIPIGQVWTSISINNSSTVQTRNIRYLNTEWYAPLDNGSISRSTDGNTFTEISTSTTTALRDISYNGTSYVAVGVSGRIISSGNGTSWTNQTSGTTATVTEIVWASATSLFIARLGSGASVITSPTGATWTSRATGSAKSPVTAIAYGAGLFVAGITDDIRTSPDAVTWTARTNPTGSTQINVIRFNNGVFVLGTNESGEIATSTDGITWTEQYVTSLPVSDIVYVGNSTWIAVCTNANHYISFDNGTTWQSNTQMNVTTPTPASFDDGKAAYNNDKLIVLNSAVSNRGSYYSDRSGSHAAVLTKLTEVSA